MLAYSNVLGFGTLDYCHPRLPVTYNESTIRGNFIFARANNSEGLYKANPVGAGEAKLREIG